MRALAVAWCWQGLQPGSGIRLKRWNLSPPSHQARISSGGQWGVTSQHMFSRLEKVLVCHLFNQDGDTAHSQRHLSLCLNIFKERDEKTRTRIKLGDCFICLSIATYRRFSKDGIPMLIHLLNTIRVIFCQLSTPIPKIWPLQTYPNICFCNGDGGALKKRNDSKL